MRNRKQIVWLGVGALSVAAGAFLAGRAFAGGIPATAALTYSGTLEDAAGAALTGSHNVQVNFWSAASAGTNVCPQTTSTSIQLDAGRFTYPLPDTCTAAVKASPDVWAEVEVDGASLGRTKIGVVPYAVEAGHATAADTATNATTAGTANAAGGALKTAVDQLQADVATLKTNLGAMSSAPASPVNVTTVGWSWIVGTPSTSVTAGERVFVWNTAVISALNTSGGATCTACASYTDGKYAPCWVQNGVLTNPHVGQATHSNVTYGAEDLPVTTTDYFDYASATANVQFGLCAFTSADSVHRDFVVGYPTTLALRARVHGP